jgi:hypothetical protein
LHQTYTARFYTLIGGFVVPISPPTQSDHVDLATILDHPAQPDLLKSELLLDDPERMFTFGSDVRVGGLDQYLQPSIWSGGQI